MAVTFIQSGRFAAAGGYDTDASALFARWGTDPGSTRKQLYSDCIAGLKTDGLWSLLDEVQMYAAHTQADGLLGWKNLVNATAVNSPTFTTDRGVAGDASTSYINTGFNPSTHGSQYQQNSAMAGVYLNAGTDTAATVSALGCVEGVTTQLVIGPRIASNRPLTRINDFTNSLGAVSSSMTRLGLTVVNRSTSTATQVYRNGSSIATGGVTSVGRPNANVYACGQNDGGLSGALDNRVALVVFGASMDATQQANLSSRMITLLTAIGAN